MKKRIVFVVGHENWGKTRTLNGLKDTCGSQGRRITIKETEFLVRSMSNDDKPEPYISFMHTISRPAIIAALCPKFRRLMKPEENPRKAIDEMLKVLKRRGYTLFFWVLDFQWASCEKVSQEQIEELRLYGCVKVFDDRKAESNARAKEVRDFISNVVLA